MKPLGLLNCALKLLGCEGENNNCERERERERERETERQRERETERKFYSFGLQFFFYPVSVKDMPSISSSQSDIIW